MKMSQQRRMRPEQRLTWNWWAGGAWSTWNRRTILQASFPPTSSLLLHLSALDVTNKWIKKVRPKFFGQRHSSHIPLLLEILRAQMHLLLSVRHLA